MPGVPVGSKTRLRPLPRTTTWPPPSDISTERTSAWSPPTRPPRGGAPVATGVAGGGARGGRGLALAPFRLCLRAIDGNEAYRENPEGAGKWRWCVAGTWAATLPGALACCRGPGHNVVRRWLRDVVSRRYLYLS